MDIQIVEVGYKPFDIGFVTIDEDYGRAEFTLCIRRREGVARLASQRKSSDDLLLRRPR